MIGLGLDQGILNVIPSLIREKFKNVNHYIPRINLIVFLALLFFGVLIYLFNLNLILSITIITFLLSFDFFGIKHQILIKALILVITFIFCLKQYLEAK
jgi:prepilin signal peptidase PulO-like enzyme (type II secretory pathway)